MNLSRRHALLRSATFLFPGPALAWAGDRALPRIEIFLDPEVPERSLGRLFDSSGREILRFAVGLGKKGILPAGSLFQAGYSLLGDFRVNAILSASRFDMEPRLIAQSGRSGDWLRAHLFGNMSSIDFDGDGKGGEYGAAYLGLEPAGNGPPQPFHFGEYRGVFRWYGFALHGTQHPSRIGRRVTGGCINAAGEDLEVILQHATLGMPVSIRRLERP